MTQTLVESKTKTAIIGFDQPFCVIGERINPTGRKLLAAQLENGDFSTVEKDALSQVKAGATMLDINAGVVYNSNPNPNETEPPLMVEMLRLVQKLVDVPLCIDSSVPSALEAGLAVAEGRPLLNSVTGEEDRLEAILPLVKKYNVPVVAISNDDTGISEAPEVRFRVAKKIVERASDFGIPANDIVVDPLVMPIGAMGTAARWGEKEVKDPEYFPIDQFQSTRSEDPYSVAKWVGEQIGDAFARRNPDMSIGSMRFNGMWDDNKFKELKSLIYDYRDKKEQEIKDLNENQLSFKNEIEANHRKYEKLIDEAADEISSFVEKAKLENISQ